MDAAWEWAQAEDLDPPEVPGPATARSLRAERPFFGPEHPSSQCRPALPNWATDPALALPLYIPPPPFHTQHPKEAACQKRLMLFSRHGGETALRIWSCNMLSCLLCQRLKLRKILTHLQYLCGRHHRTGQTIYFIELGRLRGWERCRKQIARLRRQGNPCDYYKLTNEEGQCRVLADNPDPFEFVGEMDECDPEAVFLAVRNWATVPNFGCGKVWSASNTWSPPVEPEDPPKGYRYVGNYNRRMLSLALARARLAATKRAFSPDEWEEKIREEIEIAGTELYGPKDEEGRRRQGSQAGYSHVAITAEKLA